MLPLAPIATVLTGQNVTEPAFRSLHLRRALEIARVPRVQPALGALHIQLVESCKRTSTTMYRRHPPTTADLSSPLLQLRHIPTVGGSSLPLLSYKGAWDFQTSGRSVLQWGYTKVEPIVWIIVV